MMENYIHIVLSGTIEGRPTDELLEVYVTDVDPIKGTKKTFDLTEALSKKPGIRFDTLTVRFVGSDD